MQSSLIDKMLNVRPVKLLLPGFFLFILGIGNIGVGVVRGEQYSNGVQEATSVPSISKEEAFSNMANVQLEKFSSQMLSQREQKFENRKNFYASVEISGKIMLVISVFLIICGGSLWGMQHRFWKL